MSYTNFDFTESIDRSSVEIKDIKNIIAAWGLQQDEWEGGFLIELNDGRFLYLTGWCDYTGWGCQDGIVEEFFNKQPLLSDLEIAENCEWDMQPTDLNLLLNK